MAIPSDLRWTLVGGAALTFIAVLMLATVWDYGLTWDEEFHSVYGDLVLAWYESGFQDDGALLYKNMYLYGGFFDVLAQLFARLSPLALYDDRHLMNVAFTLLALAGTWRLGRLVIGPRGGVAAMVLTALTPMFYGHGFNNPKDIPFAALFVWTLWYLYQSARSLPVVSTWATAKLTLAFGVLLAIRPGGIFVFAYIALWWGLSLLRGGAPFRLVRRAAGSLAMILLGAWAIMLVFWPWAQMSPIVNPLRGIKNAARFAFTGTTLFFGEHVPAQRPPLEYIPVWFGLQLPEVYFVALAAGLAAFVARRRWSAENRRASAMVQSQESRIALGFLAFVVFFPIVAAIILRSTLYDAARHFLFVIPPLAILAAAGIESGLRPPVPSAARILIACAVLSGAAVTAWDMAVLHPYQSIYFNRLIAGGLSGAEGRFETDYWGNGYREAVEWVVRNVPGEGIRIANCSYPLQTSYYLRDAAGARFISVPIDDRPDLLLATTRWDCHRRPDARVLHTVERQGVALVYVLDLRP